MHSIELFLRRSSPWAAALLLVCGGLASCSDDAAQPVVDDIRVLSGRADLVSGGDTLVEIKLPQSAATADVHVTLNGMDVTSAFHPDADQRLIGLVGGLRDGGNQLSAQVSNGPGKTLTVTNHPQGGPLISGPQLQPWICETEKSGLGPPVDAQCNAAAAVVDYLYKSTDTSIATLQPYDPAQPPKNVATTMLEDGRSVPFIVRRETGTVNRGIYSTAVLADPSARISPVTPPAAWNRGLWYVLLGGALGQFRQGPYTAAADPRLAVLALPQLGKGYVTAASTLTTFGEQTNSVVSAETIMMVKERISKSIGEIGFTLSTGGSGGSLQQNLIANTYPGLIDGINPQATYSDVWSQDTEIQDCSLLVRYFDGPSSALWPSVTQQNAVMDNANELPGTCRAWVQVHHLDEAFANPESTACFHAAATLTAQRIEQSWMYDETQNPTGARCTLQDYQRNIFGLRSDGFARRPYDNVGVQYGWIALKKNLISMDQFLDLNEKIGGKDINGKPTAQRTIGDPDALAALYRSGQMNLFTNAGGTPIIDARACSNSEIHSCFQSFKLRARLQATLGSTANAVLLLDKPATDQSDFDMLAAWVRAIKADKTPNITDAAKVARNRPASAVDACWIGNAKVTDAAQCASAKPHYGDPRTGAGEAISVSVAKCQLAALDRSSYPGPISDEQWARLVKIFPSGVCDWAKPSAGMAAAVPWLSYANGAGGTPLGDPPVAKLD